MSEAPSKQPKTKRTWPLELSRGGHSVRIFRTENKQGYEFFTVAYYQHGTRQRKYFSSAKEARGHAKDALASLVDGETEAAGMRLADVRSYQVALATLAPTRISLESACKEFAACVALLGGHASVLQAVREHTEAMALLKSVPVLSVVREHLKTKAEIVAERTFEQVADELLAAKERGRATRAGGKGGKVSEKYVSQVRIRLDRLKKSITGPITSVTANQLNEVLIQMKDPDGHPVSGRTRNNYVETIRQVFRYAMKEKYLPRTCEVLDHVEVFEDSSFEIEIYTVEEMKRLLAHASDALLPVLAIGAFAGMRYYELTRLDWSDIKLDQGHIEVKARNAKTKARRLIPIAPALAQWLKPHRKASGPVWEKADTYLSECQIQCARLAGMTWKHNALRHSYISYRVAVLKNVAEVALEAGNSPAMIFQHYRELVTEAQGKEWFSITPAVVAEFKAQQEAERKEKIVPLQAAAAA